MSLSKYYLNTDKSNEKYKDEFVRLLDYPLVWNSKLPSKREFTKQGLIYLEGTTANVVSFICYNCKVVSSIDLNNTANVFDISQVSHAVGCTLENNIPIIDNKNMKDEKQRLISFLNTNWTYPVDPKNLAKYGFFWKGPNDLSVCFVCRLEIQGWENGDEAESEHRKWNAVCPLLNGVDVGNIPLTKLQLNLNQTPMHPSDPSTCDAIKILKGNPAYITYQKRIDSYTLWPSSLSHKVSCLALAGFYYTGKGDRVICFCCKGGLKDWSAAENPWIEHIVYYPKCEYIQKACSPAYIDWVKVVCEKRIKNNAIAIDGAGSSSADSSRLIADGVPELSIGEMETDESTSSNKRICKVCMEKELGIVFLPCAHMATCPDCAPQLSNCPICRKKAIALVKASLPEVHVM